MMTSSSAPAPTTDPEANAITGDTDQTRRTPRRRLAVWLIIIALLALSGVVAWSLMYGRLPFGPPSFHGLVIQSPNQVPDFTLTTHTGERMSLSELRGKVVLLYYGYTFCPDVCPTTMNELKKMNAALGRSADDVQIVLVSLDPDRDTPDVLREYLSHFDPSFLGLTGTDEELLAATTPLGIYYSRHEGTAATGYLVDHTASVTVIDKEGYLRLVYPFDTKGQDMADDVRYLARQ